RIQRRVVIHLELAICLVSLAAGKQVVGKLLSGARKIVVLSQGDGQFASDTFAVFRCGIGSITLLGEVIDPQCQNGEAIDGAAERFRVLRSGGWRSDTAARQLVGNPVV